MAQSREPWRITVDDCTIALLSSEDYEECYVDAETPHGILFRISDEPGDKGLVFEFIEPATEEIRARVSVDDLRQLIDAACRRLVPKR